MNQTEFVQAVAKAIDRSYDLCLADETEHTSPVMTVWGPGADADTIIVTDSDGVVYDVSVTTLHRPGFER